MNYKDELLVRSLKRVHKGKYGYNCEKQKKKQSIRNIQKVKQVKRQVAQQKMMVLIILHKMIAGGMNRWCNEDRGNRKLEGVDHEWEVPTT